MPIVVWITGALGFSGRHLAHYLRTLPEPIVLIGAGRRSSAGAENFDAYHTLDIGDEAAMKELAEAWPPNRVFHLAGRIPPAPEEELWQTNVRGTLSLLRALEARPKRGLRVLSIGSAAEYLPAAGNLKESGSCGGVTPYGRTKWAQTVLALASARERKMHLSVARPFNLLGPGLSLRLVAGSLCAQFAANPKGDIKVGDLRSLRDFVDVRDAVAAYWRILQRGRAGAIYNVSSGRATSIRTLVRSFAALSGFKGTFRESPSRLRRGEIDRACGDNARLRRLGWSPSISLRRSLSDMLEVARSS